MSILWRSKTGLRSRRESPRPDRSGRPIRRRSGLLDACAYALSSKLVGAPKAWAPARRFRGNIRVYLPRFFENSGRLRAVLTTSAPPGLAHSRLESAAPFAACDGARRQSNDDCCMQTRSRRKINAPHHSINQGFHRGLGGGLDNFGGKGLGANLLTQVREKMDR